MKICFAFVFLFTGFSLESFAQFSFFEAEGKLYYDVSGAVPGSDVEFYSERWGGKLIRTATVDETGKFSLITDVKFEPAFVLNRSAVNSNNVEGNGYVHFLEEREFSLRDLSIDRNNEVCLIKWAAAVADRRDISFEIFKSTDGITFRHFETVYPSLNKEFQDYSVSDFDNDAVAHYRIVVNSAAKGKRYTSSILSLKQLRLNVYPSFAENEIIIETAVKNVHYTILNQQGQSIRGGIMPTEKYVVDISNLSAGIYYVVVNTGSLNETRNFIKK